MSVQMRSARTPAVRELMSTMGTKLLEAISPSSLSRFLIPGNLGSEYSFSPQISFFLVIGPLTTVKFSSIDFEKSQNPHGWDNWFESRDGILEGSGAHPGWVFGCFGSLCGQGTHRNTQNRSSPLCHWQNPVTRNVRRWVFFSRAQIALGVSAILFNRVMINERTEHPEPPTNTVFGTIIPQNIRFCTKTQIQSNQMFLFPILWRF